MNIIGNIQAFDPDGNPTSFNIVGVEVTVGNSTFMVPIVRFNFGGNPSVTFVDSLDFDTVTFFAEDPTFSFSFNAGRTLLTHTRCSPQVCLSDLVSFMTMSKCLLRSLPRSSYSARA